MDDMETAKKEWRELRKLGDALGVPILPESDAPAYGSGVAALRSALLTMMRRETDYLAGKRLTGEIQAFAQAKANESALIVIMSYLVASQPGAGAYLMQGLENAEGIAEKMAFGAAKDGNDALNRRVGAEWLGQMHQFKDNLQLAIDASDPSRKKVEE